MKKKNDKKYWCLDQKRWVEEYRILWIFTIYKLSLFNENNKWTFKESTNEMHGPVKSKVYMTYSEAERKYGPKVCWPLHPWTYIPDDE